MHIAFLKNLRGFLVYIVCSTKINIFPCLYCIFTKIHIFPSLCNAFNKIKDLFLHILLKQTDFLVSLSFLYQNERISLPTYKFLPKLTIFQDVKNSEHQNHYTREMITIPILFPCSTYVALYQISESF